MRQLTFKNNDGEVLGVIEENNILEFNCLVRKLNRGRDPIAEQWGDGFGNKLNMKGWG